MEVGRALESALYGDEAALQRGEGTASPTDTGAGEPKHSELEREASSIVVAETGQASEPQEVSPAPFNGGCAEVALNARSDLAPPTIKTILPADRTIDLVGDKVSTKGMTLQQLARRHTRAALANILRKQRSRDEKISLHASELIHNRGWGQPTTDAKITINDDANKDAPVIARIKKLSDLANDPQYLNDVMRVLGQNGLLPGTERTVEADFVEPEAPKLIEEVPRPVEVEVVTDPAKMEVCYCGGTALEHPGLGGCEHCPRCNLYKPASSPDVAETRRR